MESLSNEVIIHQKKEGIEYIQFRKLLEFEELVHAYTLKHNNMNLSAAQGKEIAMKQYDRVAKVLDIQDYYLIKPRGEHKNHVATMTAPITQHQWEEHQKTDGVCTNQPNQLLATTSADCMTLLCYEPRGKVIASIHSGWRGTFQKIAPIAIQTMIQTYQIDPKEMLCGICPTIRSCHFEVGEEVVDYCKQILPARAKETDIIRPSTEKKDKWYIDTVALQKLFLQEVGIQENHILDSGICSVEASSHMYSYRADKALKGLNAGVILRKGEKE